MPPWCERDHSMMPLEMGVKLDASHNRVNNMSS